MNYLQLLQLAAPETIVTITMLAVLGCDLTLLRERSVATRFRFGGLISIFGCVLAAIGLWSRMQVNHDAAVPYHSDLFNGFLVAGPVTDFVKIALLVLTIFTILISTSGKFTDHVGEYLSLILLGTVGLMFLVSAEDLLMIFISLEFASLSLYILTAFNKHNEKSSEAALKYFLFGGTAAAFLLFGFSLLYGISGSTNLSEIARSLSGRGLDPLLVVAIVTTVIGFGFKVALVPFHAWAPDVYEGAPTTITAMLAAGSKKMGFIALFKLFLIGLIALKADWSVVVAIIAIATMTVGNPMALSQTNIKRMLAYSSIAQAGYILIAIPVATQYALAGGIFQIMTHAFMKGGAFIAVATLATVAIGETITEYKGLAKRSAFMAFAIAIFLFALAGIPPLSGFASKFVLFSAPISAAVAGSEWLLWLAVAGIINSAIFRWTGLDGPNW
ncbi:MAG: NADH-quinone oxidoreductase subunit N, partial [Verrucomicrobiota bacterium]